MQVGKIAAWKGIVSFRVAAKVTGQNGGSTFTGMEDEFATYNGTFRPDPFSSDPVWRIETGTAQANINDEYFENSQGTSQRTANTGQNSADIPAGALRLILSKDGKSYSVEYNRADCKIKYTIYEVNDPNTVWQEPSDLLWYAPAFTISDIPMPTRSDHLTGTRRIKVPVGLHIGDAPPVDADVTWDFQPVASPPGGKVILPEMPRAPSPRVATLRRVLTRTSALSPRGEAGFPYPRPFGGEGGDSCILTSSFFHRLPYRKCTNSRARPLAATKRAS